MGRVMMGSLLTVVKTTFGHTQDDPFEIHAGARAPCSIAKLNTGVCLERHVDDSDVRRPKLMDACTAVVIKGDVMRRTEEEIAANMDRLQVTRPRVWEALELRKKLAVWQARTSSLTTAEVVRSVL